MRSVGRIYDQMNLTLLEFLRCGKIPGLEIGMTQQEVASALGVPEDIGCVSHKHPQPAIFKYGNLQLFFNRSDQPTLTCIYVESSAAAGDFTLPSLFSSDWAPIFGMSRAEVIDYLVKNGLSSVVTTIAEIESLTVASSGVQIGFDEGHVWCLSASSRQDTHPLG